MMPDRSRAIVSLLVVALLASVILWSLPPAFGSDEGLVCHGDCFDELSDLVVEVRGNFGSLRFSGRDIVALRDLPPGTYQVTAWWRGVEVGRWVLGVTSSNLAVNLGLALTDVSLEIRDMEGRVLGDSEVEVFPEVYGELSIVGGVISIRAIPTTLIYILNARWRSPIYGSEASVTLAATPQGLNEMRSVTLPVGDVELRVVDPKGRPLARAVVEFGGVSDETDAFGRALFQQVPLEVNGTPLAYEVRVIEDGNVIYSGVEEVSRSKTTITIIGELYDLKVRVEGAAGQPLPFAKITLRRAGVELGTFSADEGGVAVIKRLPLSDYEVEAEWKGFRGSTTVYEEDLKMGRLAVIALPPYAEFMGIPLTFYMLIMFIIGSVIAVLLIAVIVSEYIMWRGRRLGIYPPKKKAER